MIRYFVSYKNLTEDVKLEMDLNSPELVLIKKNKNGNFRVEPILYFNGYRQDLVFYADKLTQSKKGIYLMVELNETEVKKINPLYLKVFETLDDEENKNILKERNKEEIKLINYNCYRNMTVKELDLGFIVLVNSIPNNDKVSIKVVDNNFSFENIKNILSTGLGNGIYFYTEDEELLEKYQDDITLLKEIDIDTYKITSHKIIVIDSISQDRVYDLNNSSLRSLYEICNSSIPINISENEDSTYDIYLHRGDKKNKKAYRIVNFDIQNLICDSLLVPLLKYIYVYELKDGHYIKIHIEDYMKDKDILKYIKKPSKN